MNTSAFLQNETNYATADDSFDSFKEESGSSDY
jgi:hypothetical protein